MKDFKKMPKMADGGSVFAEDRYSPSQVNELFKKGHIVEKQITKDEAKQFDKALKIDRTKSSPTRTGGSGGSMGGGDMSGMKGLDKPYKRGGKVKK